MGGRGKRGQLLRGEKRGATERRGRTGKVSGEPCKNRERPPKTKSQKKEKGNEVKEI